MDIKSKYLFLESNYLPPLTWVIIFTQLQRIICNAVLTQDIMSVG